MTVASLEVIHRIPARDGLVRINSCFLIVLWGGNSEFFKCSGGLGLRAGGGDAGAGFFTRVADVGPWCGDVWLIDDRR